MDLQPCNTQHAIFSDAGFYEQPATAHENPVATTPSLKPREEKIPSDWKPSVDVKVSLMKRGVTSKFIDMAALEFRYYWQERGSESAIWNTKFSTYAMGSWRENRLLTTQPLKRKITHEWMPAPITMNILRGMGMSEEDIERKRQNFTLYWVDTGDGRDNWNSQFVKYSQPSV